MRLTVLFLLAVFVNVLFGQQAAHMVLEKTTSSEGVCYEAIIDYQGDKDIMIASQNYRIFYSSSSLELDPDRTLLLLPEENYTYTLVQHKNHVDGSAVGVLPYDKDLGFINASAILNNTNSLGTQLNRTAPHLPVLRVCFDVINDGPKHITFAREELTKGYGRAYVDISYVEANHQLQTLDIKRFIDIKE